jgi:hypothetical protein
MKIAWLDKTGSLSRQIPIERRTHKMESLSAALTELGHYLVGQGVDLSDGSAGMETPPTTASSASDNVHALLPDISSPVSRSKPRDCADDSATTYFERNSRHSSLNLICRPTFGYDEDGLKLIGLAACLSEMTPCTSDALVPDVADASLAMRPHSSQSEAASEDATQQAEGSKLGRAFASVTTTRPLDAETIKTLSTVITDETMRALCLGNSPGSDASGKSRFSGEFMASDLVYKQKRIGDACLGAVRDIGRAYERARCSSIQLTAEGRSEGEGAGGLPEITSLTVRWPRRGPSEEGEA